MGWILSYPIIDLNQIIMDEHKNGIGNNGIVADKNFK